MDIDLDIPAPGPTSLAGTDSSNLSSLSSGVGAPGSQGSYPAHRLPTFIDKVANAFELNPKYRGELHAFKELALELPAPFWRTTLYQQGAIYKTLQNTDDFRADMDRVKHDVKDLGAQMVKQCVINEDQRDDILALSKQMVLEAGREDYNFATEQVQRLKNVKDFPRFKDVFKLKAHTKAVTQVVRRQSSYARNACRQFMRDTVFDARKKCGLTACARGAARKFNGGEDPTPEQIFQIAILRRFMRENRDLVKGTDDDPWDSADDDSDATEQEPPNGTRKRKRARQAAHFWGAFTEFMKRQNALRGRGFQTDQWKAYIDECLAQERVLFPDDALRAIPQRSSSASSSNEDTYHAPSWAQDDATPEHDGFLAPPDNLAPPGNPAPASFNHNDHLATLSTGPNTFGDHTAPHVPGQSSVLGLSSFPSDNLGTTSTHAHAPGSLSETGFGAGSSTSAAGTAGMFPSTSDAHPSTPARSGGRQFSPVSPRPGLSSSRLGTPASQQYITHGTHTPTPGMHASVSTRSVHVPTSAFNPQLPGLNAAFVSSSAHGSTSTFSQQLPSMNELMSNAGLSSFPPSHQSHSVTAMPPSLSLATRRG